jgi:hypothetical protein
MPFTCNGDQQLIKMSPITRSRRATAEAIGKLSVELLTPEPLRFVADLNLARGQLLLNDAQAPGKAEMEPDRAAFTSAGKR